jgi:hypothetical protein
MALETAIKMVVERVAQDHGWTLNQTIEEVSQLSIFDALSDPETFLWTESPVDLADMIETELRGGTIDPSRYFK